MMISEAESDRKPRTEIEALERSRRHMLMAVVATSTLGFLPQIVYGIKGDWLAGPFHAAFVLAGAVSALVFVAFMMRFHRFRMRVHGDPALRRRLDDERVLQMRMQAVYRGWLVLVVALAVGVALAPFADLPDQAVLMTLMLLAVNAPIVAFLIMDRD